MTSVTSIAEIAALIGEPSRATMLVSLMDGRALTAGELGIAAGVTPPTASEHLGRMLETGLLAVERQGRHRYYRIASPSVAGLVETLMSVSGELAAVAGRCKPVRTGPRDRALRRARLCYDHLAGELAVGIATGMVARGHLEWDRDGGAVTEQGLAVLAGIGVDLSGAARHPQGSAFCRPCLDWSERRPHIAGALGRSLYAALVGRGWIRQPGDGRAVAVTPLGLRELGRHFDVDLS
jgi:DNA-binding transcriptional ArsR family regulator